MSDDKEPPTNKDQQVEQDERPDNASGLTINPEEVAQEIREQRETIRQLEAERESATRQAAHTSQQLESLKRLVNSMTDEIRQVRQQRDTMEENILDTVSPQDSASQTQGDQAPPLS
jgi:predicted  nucleic acid-binding Zn-ribbon protein